MSLLGNYTEKVGQGDKVSNSRAWVMGLVHVVSEIRAHFFPALALALGVCLQGGWNFLLSMLTAHLGKSSLCVMLEMNLLGIFVVYI